jgi:hypothetical protein
MFAELFDKQVSDISTHRWGQQCRGFPHCRTVVAESSVDNFNISVGGMLYGIDAVPLA